MGNEFTDFRISEPNLHDGSLERLWIRGKDVEIGCTDVAGHRVNIWLIDVLHLKADDFRSGNIIFSLEVFIGSNCPEDVVRQAAGLKRDDPGEWVPLELAAIADAGWVGVRIASSYGCELAAVCKSWRFESETTERRL